MMVPGATEPSDPNGPARRIIAVAAPHFLSRGVSPVTMADLAAELGMSKKTLYQHFRAKDDLLRATVDHFWQTMQAGLDAIVRDERLSFVARVERVLRLIAGNLAVVQPAAIADIKRHAPEVWQVAMRHRREVIHDEFSRLLAAGVAAGQVRADLSVPLVVRMLLAIIEQVAVPETLIDLQLTPPEIFREITTLIFEGVLTEAARAGLAATRSAAGA
jgi:AcrR family transcriptional regulator